MKHKKQHSNLSLGQKVLFGLFGLQFVSAFMNESLKIKSQKENPLQLNNEQLEYLTREIVMSSVYQALIREGKTAKEITQILEINKMTSEKFKLLTGKNWPT